MSDDLNSTIKTEEEWVREFLDLNPDANDQIAKEQYQLQTQAQSDTTDTPVLSNETAEIDVFRLRERRRNNESDTSIINDLLNQAGPQLQLNGEDVYIDTALQNGVSEKVILDYLMSGDKSALGITDSSIDSEGDAIGKAAGSAGFSLLGSPVDLVNMGLQSGESLIRRGANKLASFNAPEGVNDPDSPNYDPNFYLSQNPDDFLLSSTNPVGGKNQLTDMVNTGAKLAGLTEEDIYLKSVDQVPDEYKSMFRAAEIGFENVGFFAPFFAAAKAQGLNQTVNSTLRDRFVNNSISAEIAKNSKTAAITEGSATLGQMALGSLAVHSDNPYIQMGAEFVGSLVGGTVPNLPTGVKKPYEAAKNVGLKIVGNFSDSAKSKLAVRELLLAAGKQRLLILQRADELEANGSMAAAEKLRAEAEFYSPDRLVADFQAAENNPLYAEGSATDSVTLPLGTRSNNPFFMAVQNALSAQNPEFRSSINNEIDDAVLTIMSASEVMARVGNNPMAQVIRQRAFQKLVEGKIALAMSNARIQLAEMPNITQEAASLQAQEVLMNAKDNFRAMETALWTDSRLIDQGRVVESNSILGVIDELKGRRSAGIKLSSNDEVNNAIAAFYEKVLDPKITVTIGDYLKIRSDVLNDARVTRSGTNPDYKRAKILDELSAALIDDLRKIPVGPNDIDGLGLANGFSAALNERFTRNFPKKVLQREAQGGTTIRGEDVLRVGTESADAGTNLSELRRAATDADLFADDVEATLQGAEARRMAAAVEGSPYRNTDVATTDDVIYPENTSYPFRAAGEGFVVDDGTRIFPPDGRRGPARDFDGPVLDEDGNPFRTAGEGFVVDDGNGNLIPESELPDGETAQEKLDRMFDRPDGETYSRSETQEGPEDYIMSVPARTDPVDEASRLSLGQEMFTAQENFLRAKIASGEFTNLDGSLDVEKVDAYKKKNPWIQRDFPDFDFKLAQLREAQVDADEVAKRLGTSANAEKLPVAIADSLNSNNPEADFSYLAQQAANDPQAQADLRQAVMDFVFAKGSSGQNAKGEVPDFFTIADELTKPLNGQYSIVDGQKVPDKTLIDLMLETNIMSQADTEAVMALVSEGLRIQRSVLDQSVVNEIIKKNPDLINNIGRIAGANLGTQFGFGSGAQLQAAAIGSSFVKKFIDETPGGAANTKLEIMFRYPRQLAAMIDKNPNVANEAGAAAKEFFIKYQGMSPSEIRKAAMKEVRYKVGGAIGGNTPLSTTSALTSSELDEDPIPDLEVQMQNLGVQ